MNVVVDDLLVRYEVKGVGKTVVLLHGWGDSLQGLAQLQTQLAKTYQVISLDLPGFGASQAPAEIWDLDNYTTFLAHFLQKIDCQAYAIIGHSNGGALAIKAIGSGALQPAKLILLAASGIRNHQSAKRQALQVIAKTGNAATFWLPSSTRTGLRRKLYGAVGSDLLVVEHLQETFKKTVRQDVRADAARITIPTLLVYADKDAAVPLADGKTYQRLIAGSRLEIISGASHFLHLDEPAKVSLLIAAFIQ